MTEAIPSPRRYRGITPEERRAARKARFLDVGLEVFGTVGYQESSIKDICRAASLNQRYFYESFNTREDLLEAVYERTVQQVAEAGIAAITAAEGLENKARAGLTAWWRALAGDVRKGRVITLEMVGVSARLEDKRRHVRQMFADVLVTHSAAALGREDLGGMHIDPRLAARGLVGAVVELLLAYVQNDVDASIDELIDHCTGMFVRTAAIAAHGPAAMGVQPGPTLDRLRELESELRQLRPAGTPPADPPRFTRALSPVRPV